MSNPTTYVRLVDREAERALPTTERFRQQLIDERSGSSGTSVVYVRTPSGGGSPKGIHSHETDQFFYVLEGTMSISVDGKEFQAGPGSLVFFPAGVPHRNWNEFDIPTKHLAINPPRQST